MNMLKTHILLSNHIYHTFIVGLASYRLYRETNDANWLERGKQCTQQMRLWSESGLSSNFKHKIFLLQAEEERSLGNSNAARASYKSATLAARENKYTHDEALTTELTAGFYFDLAAEKSSSLEHYIMAHEKYEKWGAIGKANQLFDLVKSKFHNA